ncbi:hypothetical protein UM546_12890 [Staphylococcus aureus]|nr:hypothetical protein UM546_12890 [Staphylococcus aureus]WRN17351.1 hypothetical protein UM526_09420 [Staphylococcus aureus]
MNRKNIPELYQEEAQSLARELEGTIKQFNNVIDKINNMNEEYREDMYKFDSLIDQNEMKKIIYLDNDMAK